MKKHSKTRTKKGSVLAYSLIILTMMLAITAGMAAIAVMEKKNASSTEFSVQAYQTADSGIQLAIKKINDNLSSSIATVLGACDASGEIKGNTDAIGGTYDLSFFDTAGTPITDCAGTPVNQINMMRSVATYKNTVRAVDVSMAADDSYTRLLLHADGTGSSLVDSEVTPKIITANGGATQSSTQSKFGGKSAYFDGSGDFLSMLSSTDFDFGLGDFTIDFWENSSSNLRQHALSFGQLNVSNIDFDFNDSSGIWVYWNGAGGNRIRAGAVGQYCNGAWHHIALVKEGNTLTLYVDGNSVGNTVYPNAINLSGAATYHLGSGVGDFYWNGYLDEIRISKGIARWTANFTPPTSAY